MWDLKRKKFMADNQRSSSFLKQLMKRASWFIVNIDIEKCHLSLPQQRICILHVNIATDTKHSRCKQRTIFT